MVASIEAVHCTKCTEQTNKQEAMNKRSWAIGKSKGTVDKWCRRNEGVLFDMEKNQDGFTFW